MNNFLIDYCHVEKDFGIYIYISQTNLTLRNTAALCLVKLLLNLTSSEELVILLKVLINVERYILQW